MSVNSHRFSLYKRLNGIYYVGYYEQGRRKWKSTGVSTKPEALKALTQFRELLSTRSRSIPLEQFFKEFLSYAETNYSHKSQLLFRGVFNSFLRTAPRASLRGISPEHIDKYKAGRLRQISPVSVNVGLRMLRAAFNTARRWKLIEQDVFAGVSFALVPQSAPVFLTFSDFQKLISCIKENWLREVVIFAALTGMRRGEILNLTWPQVDMEKKLIHVETSPTFKTKQGRRRTLPFNDTVFYLLKSRYGKSPSEYVFTLNDKKIYEDWVTHLFKRYVRRANLSDTRLKFHSLRHTFASWLVQGGATLYEVQKLLGHSSSKVTEIYSHLAPSELHSTVNKITFPVN